MDDLTNQLQNLNINSNKLRLAELYTGTGGFSLAFESTGRFETVFANDIKKQSKYIYDLNFSTQVYLKDLNDIDVKKEIPKMDILTGGFNCQPFSMDGKQLGFNDARTNSFWKIIEIMNTHRPRFVVLENVKNLKYHDECKSFRKIKDELRKTGYKLRYRVLNTRKVTMIPQNRERLYVICFRNKRDYKRFEFPKRIDKVHDMNLYLEKHIPDRYYYDERYGIWPKIRYEVTERGIFYRYRSYIRKMRPGICPTLKTQSGSVPFIRDDKGIRKLTPRECFNLQGFPQTYEFGELSNTSLYALAGNAITVKVVKRIADEIVKLL